MFSIIIIQQQTDTDIRPRILTVPDECALLLDVIALIAKHLVSSDLHSTCAKLNLTCRAVHEGITRVLYQLFATWALNLVAKAPHDNIIPDFDVGAPAVVALARGRFDRLLTSRGVGYLYGQSESLRSRSPKSWRSKDVPTHVGCHRCIPADPLNPLTYALHLTVKPTIPLNSSILCDSAPSPDGDGTCRRS